MLDCQYHQIVYSCGEGSYIWFTHESTFSSAKKFDQLRQELFTLPCATAQHPSSTAEEPTFCFFIAKTSKSSQRIATTLQIKTTIKQSNNSTNPFFYIRASEPTYVVLVFPEGKKLPIWMQTKQYSILRLMMSIDVILSIHQSKTLCQAIPSRGFNVV